MTRRLPPLNAMRAFEATARHGSITRAAGELCVTQGAVSRHVAQLEAWLGVRLFTRERHGVSLTPEGTTYFGAVKGALDQVEQGGLAVQRRPTDARLRLKLPPTFAIRWLVPRLARFHALHPSIDVQITTSHQRVDFRQEDVDIGIHSEVEPPHGDEYVRLFGETLLPVCAPGLIADAPAVSPPGGLFGLTLLSSLNRPLDWSTWFTAAGLEFSESEIGLKFENAALAYQAAIDRLGVMIAQLALVADDLAAGRLVAPFALRVPTRGAYYMQFRAGQPKTMRVEAFEAWVLQEARTVDSA